MADTTIRSGKVTLFGRYAKWLHTRWPAGVVEKLPESGEDGTTNVPGVYIVGDLTGIPLLKFSSHSGARAIRSIAADPAFKEAGTDPELLDVVIIGAGVSGVAAAMEAEKLGLRYQLFEASQIFSTVVNFPKGKPIYTYPTDMKPDGDLQFRAKVKEALVDEMEARRRAAGVEAITVRVEKIERNARAADRRRHRPER
jgi:NosR/NirI family nitrous oxide reductase transcriptional regulator